MWEKVIWTHPVKRRFVTRIGLTGRVLRQEISGTQTRAVVARGATQTEYASLVTEQAESAYVDGLDFSAEPTFRHGYERFSVNVSGSRLVPAENTGIRGSVLGSDPEDGSYVYDPVDAALT